MTDKFDIEFSFYNTTTLSVAIFSTLSLYENYPHIAMYTDNSHLIFYSKALN
ncbi:hypothetical protein HMPREF0813_00852 [Streptococcus anginosus F0211]|uniref:Uncharacterized protein n=1 Tax=Streptococcus anginosus F0211 TaxID=706437 RepID=E6J0S8_STRAP|nr:hypothetical protein HMPREF0813_00852 [Streptococcus anginosus F0211]